MTDVKCIETEQLCNAMKDDIFTVLELHFFAEADTM